MTGRVWRTQKCECRWRCPAQGWRDTAHSEYAGQHQGFPNRTFERSHCHPLAEFSCRISPPVIVRIARHKRRVSLLIDSNRRSRPQDEPTTAFLPMAMEAADHPPTTKSGPNTKNRFDVKRRASVDIQLPAASLGHGGVPQRTLVVDELTGVNTISPLPEPSGGPYAKAPCPGSNDVATS